MATILPLQPGSATLSGNRQQAAFDSLIRRELKVTDPSDAQQVAQALADRYRGEARARSIGSEAEGLPPRLPVTAAVAPAAPTATSLDLDQAADDVRQDIGELLRSNHTKDVRPELEGWQQTIGDLIDDGVSAARQGVDAYCRDRAFAQRRQLGEYARLARLVGALTPELNEDYRNLAQSLDEACAVLLVLMGESLANAGFAGGRYLLQVPFSELQARRDAVLVALRNLSGGTQESLTQSTWPRGLDAYRQLYRLLEERGQVELRSLLSEAELARVMDEMVQMAGGGSTAGMRKIGATAWGPVNRFQRFVQTTLHGVQPASPALASFQEALQLFVDGFRSANTSGFRLLRIARPTVLLYGLYGSTRLEPADRRLIELTQLRGQLASSIDCVSRCQCDKTLVQAQIVLDKLLFDVDRAIDLYAIGDNEFGVPEKRAAAYGVLIGAAIAPPSPPAPPAYLGDFDAAAGAASDKLNLNLQLERLCQVLTPQAANPGLWTGDQGWRDLNLGPFTLPSANDRSLVERELLLQIETDQNWRPLVQQMSSGCIPMDDVFAGLELRRLPAEADYDHWGCLAALQLGALLRVGSQGDLLQEHRLKIPRDAETSWDEIARIETSVGQKPARSRLRAAVVTVPAVKKSTAPRHKSRT